MPKHTTIKKRGAKSGAKSRAKSRAKSGKRVGGTRKRVVGTRKRVGGPGKRKHTTTTRKRKGGGVRNPAATMVKGEITTPGDAAAGRRLAQAIAFRLGFKPETIYEIMGEKRLQQLPTTITNNDDVRKTVQNLGQIGSTCNVKIVTKVDESSGRNRFATALKGPFTKARDSAAARRLLQAVAIRLGFEPQTIHKIMGEDRLKPVPTTITNNVDVKAELGELGQLKGTCTKINDDGLDTSDANQDFVYFENTGNVITRNIGRNRKNKQNAYMLEKLRNRGVKLQEFLKRNQS